MRKSISAAALLVILTFASTVVVSGEASVNAANTTKPIVRLLNSTTKQAKTSQAARSTTLSTTTIAPTTVAPTAGSAPARLVVAARSQVGVTTGYDPSYVRLAYPGGDVPIETGVCSDVIIRALRKLDIDLQVKIHEDMAKNFSKYPKKWGLKKTDTNIDHRRVGNISTYFTRRGYSLPVTKSAADYLPGDIVAIKLPLDHIGIVSDKKAANGNPLVIHNIGNGAQEEDILFAYELVGHYRVLN
jgi:uncharacterized protein